MFDQAAMKYFKIKYNFPEIFTIYSIANKACLTYFLLNYFESALTCQDRNWKRKCYVIIINLFNVDKY